MRVTCPACHRSFHASNDHEPDTGFYCPECGHGFIYGQYGNG